MILLSKPYILNVSILKNNNLDTNIMLKIKDIKGNDEYERKKIYKIKSKYVRRY